MFNQTLPSLTTELLSLVSIELVRAERRRRRIQVIPGTFVPVLSYRITYITFSFVGHSVPRYLGLTPMYVHDQSTCIVLKYNIPGGEPGCLPNRFSDGHPSTSSSSPTAFTIKEMGAVLSTTRFAVIWGIVS